MAINVKTVAFENLKNCVSLSNGETELIISVEIGPRILFYGYVGGKNVFKLFPEQLRNVENGVWKSYGGHRLWHAPEVYPRTYYPDNEKVEWEWDGKKLKLNCPDERGTGIGKMITIVLEESGCGVTIEHKLINRGVWSVKIAAWCLSVMAPGGKVVVPQEEFKTHPDYLAPARPLILWHFTRMNDPRFTWGDRYIQLREDSESTTKQKFGVRNRKGWAAYVLGNLVFMKKIANIENAEYTDMGCNQEFYTEAGFLEIESLSPYTELNPGNFISHEERWTLAKIDGLEDESNLEKLEKLAETI